MNPPLPAPRPVPARRRESGQALVIIAASFIGLAAFIGLAIDLGILIVNQAHLRRAVDSAAIAAAGQLREGQDFRKIGQFAAQFIRLNNVDVATIVVQQCLRDPISGVININQYTTAPTETVQLLALTDVDPRIQAVCNTSTPRKQIRVEAEVDVRFSFLPIIGLFGTTIQAEAVSEAASLDVVLVIATGETMGQTTYPRSSCFGREVNSDVCTGTFDPNVSPACNANAGPEFTKMPEDDPLQHIPADPSIPAKCRPLWDAKQAAKRLVDTLYAGFDRVAVVGYDTYAQIYEIGSQALSLNLGQRATASSDSTGAYAAIDSMTLRNTPLLPADYGQFSPLNIACVSGNPTAAACFQPDPNNAVASNCAGCGLRVATNILKNTGRPESLWVIVFLSDGYTNMTDVADDFVPGRAANPLESMGSDFDAASYPNGFCPGAVGENAGDYGERIWTSPICLQGNYDINENGTVEGLEPFTINPRIRFCGPYHPGGAGTCPPGSIYVGDSGYTEAYTFTMPSGITYTGVTTPFVYNAYDYALDMVDFAALTTRCPEGVAEATCNGGALQAGGLASRYNANEQKGKPAAAGGDNLAGTNIVIYSIGLGPEVVASSRQGETLLRYMAAVADDGDRVTDPCAGVPSGANCGNYYFAPDPTALGPVFEDIARRIFTRITR